VLQTEGLDVNNGQGYTMLPQSDPDTFKGERGELELHQKYNETPSSSDDVRWYKGKLRPIDPYKFASKRKTTNTLHPDLYFLDVWSFIMITFIISDAFLQPIAAYALCMEGTSQSTYDAIYILDLFFWFFYLLDTKLRFISQVPAGEHETLLTEIKDIAAHYLRTDFALDAITLVPWCIVVPYVTGLARGMNEFNRVIVNITVNLFRLTRLIRLGTLGRLSDKFKHQIHVSFVMHSIIGNIFSLLLTLHVVGCAWALVGISSLPGDTNWIETYWPDIDKKDYQVSELYLTCFYWTLVTTTSIGFGDITPSHTNQIELVFAILAIVIVAIRWSIVIANAVELVRSLNAAGDEHKMTMDTCQRIIEENRIPHAMAMSIRTYFDQRSEMLTRKGTRTLVRAMSPQLQGQTIQIVFKAWIEDIRWFRIISHQCMVRLIFDMDNYLYCPREVIPDSRHISFVQKGLLVFGGKFLRAGDCWGVDMTIDGLTRKKDTGVAKTFVETMSLTHTDLTAVLLEYPGDSWHVKKNTCWLAVRRVTMMLARRERINRGRGQPKLTLEAAMTSLVGNSTAVMHETLGDEMRTAINILQHDFTKVFTTQQSMQENITQEHRQVVSVQSQNAERIDRLESRMQGVESTMTKAVDVLGRVEARLGSIEANMPKKR